MIPPPHSCLRGTHTGKTLSFFLTDYEAQKAERISRLESERELFVEELAQHQATLQNIEEMVKEEADRVSQLQSQVSVLNTRQQEIDQALVEALNKAILENELPIRRLSRTAGWSWRSVPASDEQECPDWTTRSPLFVDARHIDGNCIVLDSGSRPYPNQDAVTPLLDPILTRAFAEFYPTHVQLGSSWMPKEGTLYFELRSAERTLRDRKVVAENHFGSEDQARASATALERNINRIDEEIRRIEAQAPNRFDLTRIEGWKVLEEALEDYVLRLAAREFLANGGKIIEPDQKGRLLLPKNEQDVTMIVVFTQERDLRPEYVGMYTGLVNREQRSTDGRQVVVDLSNLNWRGAVEKDPEPADQHRIKAIESFILEAFD